MSLEAIAKIGIKVSAGLYIRLKAFQSGGYYWDREAQDLIRGTLGDFLPVVQQTNEPAGSVGLFVCMRNGKELLWRSEPVTASSMIPPQQLVELRRKLEDFRVKVDLPGTQPHNRELLLQFRLPDYTHDPELYRLVGPKWNRQLQILWGCEKKVNSSLTPLEALAKLPVDKFYGLKRRTALAILITLMVFLLSSVRTTWPIARDAFARIFNKPPIASLKLDFLDVRTLTATVSDDGSVDPDGHIEQWRIDWGDGERTNFAVAPKSESHTYPSERDYVIQLSCIDNFQATSAPAASVTVSFDFQKRQAELTEARKAKEEAEAAKQSAEHSIATAKEEQTKAEQEKSDAEHSQRKAQEAQDQAKKEVREAEQKMKAAEATPASTSPTAINNSTNTPSPSSVPASEGKLDTGSNMLPGSTSPSGTLPKPQTDDSELAQGHRRNDQRKGGELLMEHTYEIVKAGAGAFRKDGTLEVVLVVRDRSFPNTPLNIQEWQADGRSYKTENAQLTVNLSVGEHNVGVLIKPSILDARWQDAKVTVTTDLRQTMDADFSVTNLATPLKRPSMPSK